MTPKPKKNNYKEEQQAYKRFLEELRHEDGLIDNRLRWLLVSQTILAAAFGIMYTSEIKNPCFKPDTFVILGIIAIVGLTISTLSFFAIKAAFSAWMEYFKHIQTFSQLSKKYFPQKFRYNNEGIKIIQHGQYSSLSIPIIFIVVWAGAILYCFINWMNI